MKEYTAKEMIAGHSDSTVILKIYGGLFPDSSKTAMKILDAIVKRLDSMVIARKYCTVAVQWSII